MYVWRKRQVPRDQYDPDCPIQEAERALSSAMVLIRSQQNMLDEKAHPNWKRMTEKRIERLSDTVLMLRELRDRGARVQVRD